MNLPKTLKKSPIPSNNLAAPLEHLDLLVTAQGLDDLLARAATQRWSPRQLLEEIARSETADLARRSLERRLAQARPALLSIDEVGYLTYDSHAAALLFEIVNHRYERNSILLTTSKGFKDWNTVFPNATSIAALLDRLTHHADGTLIEGTSYRVRESELEAAARKKPQSEGKPHAR